MIWQLFRSQLSLKTQVICGILMMSSMFTVLSLSHYLYEEYCDEVHSLDLTIQQIEKSTVPTLEHLLWNVDNHAINLLLESFLKIEGIAFVKIYDQNKHPLHSVGFKSFNSYQSITKNSYPLFSPSKSKRKELLGELQVYVTKDFLWNNVLQKFRLVIFTQILKMIALSIFIYYLIHFLVTRDLKKILSYLHSFQLSKNSLSPLNLNRQLPSHIEKNQWFQGEQTKDEISLLEIELNKLFYNLTALNSLNIQKIHEQEKEIELQKAQTIESSRRHSLNEMLSGLAHEIMNPMTVIKYSSNQVKTLIEADPHTFNSEEQLSNIKIFIHKTLNSVSRIEKTLSTIVKNSRSFEEEHYQWMSLNQLLELFRQLIAKDFESHPIQFRYDIDDHLTSDEQEYFLKPQLICSVLYFLFKNALDAMDKNTTCTIELQIAQSVVNIPIDNEGIDTEHVFGLPQMTLQFRMNDWGSGIHEHHRNKIFKPFFTTKEIGKHQGLGLSLAHQLATKHLGTLQIIGLKNPTSFQLHIPAFHRSSSIILHRKIPITERNPLPNLH